MAKLFNPEDIQIIWHSTKYDWNLLKDSNIAMELTYKTKLGFKKHLVRLYNADLVKLPSNWYSVSNIVQKVTLQGTKEGVWLSNKNIVSLTYHLRHGTGTREVNEFMECLLKEGNNLETLAQS